MRHFWPSAVLALFMTGCGGGGGGNDTVSAASPALTFAPASINVTAISGTSTTITVTATATRPADFGSGAVYATVIDNSGVLTSDVQITPGGANAYNAVLHTSPSLADRRYTGVYSGPKV